MWPVRGLSCLNWRDSIAIAQELADLKKSQPKSLRFFSWDSPYFLTRPSRFLEETFALDLRQFTIFTSILIQKKKTLWFSDSCLLLVRSLMERPRTRSICPKFFFLSIFRSSCCSARQSVSQQCFPFDRFIQSFFLGMLCATKRSTAVFPFTLLAIFLFARYLTTFDAFR